MTMFLLIMILYGPVGAKNFEFAIYKSESGCNTALAEWKVKNPASDVYCSPIEVRP